VAGTAPMMPFRVLIWVSSLSNRRVFDCHHRPWRARAASS